MEVKLTDDQIAVLWVVLGLVSVKSRTGELGIIHGLDRFVSTNYPLKKAEREALDRVAQKVGLGSGIAQYGG